MKDKLQKFDLGQLITTILIIGAFILLLAAGLQLTGATDFPARAMSYVGAGLLGYALLVLIYISWNSAQNNNKKG